MDNEAYTLLIEIGTEELPPKALQSLSSAFTESIGNALKESDLLLNTNLPWYSFASPRRIAVKIEQVLRLQPNQLQQKKGPSVSVAFTKDGIPTPAAEGFAQSCGVPVDSLETLKTDKGEWLAYTQTIQGKALESIIPDILNDAIHRLPIPKRMRWGHCEHEFIRPVHWLLALHGGVALNFELMGLKSDRISRGHRFHASERISINDADQYADELQHKGFVIADYSSRKTTICDQVNHITQQHGLKPVIDPELLDEVVGLTEWPITLEGSFDQRFLNLPREVLVETMTAHQKYFHLVDQDDQITSRFIVVTNIDSRNPGRVRKGNERVLGARLSDAEYFWSSDQKIRLMDRFDRLKTLVFHNKLGSIFDKSYRIVELAKKISNQLDLDAEATELAARLCKTDLVTEMVGEFPKLQGVVGRYYALAEGYHENIAQVIETHYLPRFSGDKLPPTGLASSVAIADRVDTLCGIFACGDIPSGEKDPFSLRRASLAVLRILLENRIDLDLSELIDWGMELYQVQEWEDIDVGESVRQELLEYILARSKQLMSSQGYQTNLWNAAMSGKPTRPLDLLNRMESTKRLLDENLEIATSIIAINKRISNILRDIPNVPVSPKKIDISLLEEEKEHELVQVLLDIESRVFADKQQGKYQEGFHSLFGIGIYIDQFFDHVLINADDLRIRDNRINILQSIRSMFFDVIDFSQIRLEKS
ncbi:MAG: glycine--tRNA ligase subunit beta [Gammaproteobacteria bacterium]|nr:glycine--tRNA ligase subunit beta [Gammaproteobacteria bacterium]